MQRSTSAVHQLFATTLQVYKSVGHAIEDPRNTKSMNAAYRFAIKELNDKEKDGFNSFLKWIGSCPESSQQELQTHRLQQILLDDELSRNCLGLTSKGELIMQLDYFAKYGTDEAWLVRKLKQKRMFQVFLMVYKEPMPFIPTFFHDPRLDISATESVCKKLGDLPGISKLRFFRTPIDNHLQLTPLELIAQGQYKYVLEAASRFKNYVLLV